MSATDPQSTDSQGTSAHLRQNADNSDTPELVEPLRRISEYQLIRKIGRGGMGEVYEALHVRLKKVVAVKLLPEGRILEQATLRRFFREMEAAGRLTHPQIVQATDAGEVDGVPYLVMEFIDGADLGHMVRQFGPLPPLAALDALEQAALGLEHIHHHGLVHRDVKPSNLLMDQKGSVKVADLGLAQLNQPPSQSDDLTSSDILLGTIDYMAPEQADHPKLVDHRADIYSLGCCLHFLLTGQTVFNSTGRLERLLCHRTQLPPTLSSRCENFVPESMERLYRQMLEKQPDHRPAAMRDVLAGLLQCRKDLQRHFSEKASASELSVGARQFPALASLREVASFVFSDTFPTEGLYAKSTVICQPRRKSQRFRPYILMAVGLVLFTAGGVIWSFRNLWPATGIEQESPRKPIIPPEKKSNDDAAAHGIRDITAAHEGAVYALQFSADGQLLFSCGHDGAVRSWEVSSGTMHGEFRDADGKVMIHLAVLPQSTRVVAASYSGRASVWNWQDERIEHTFNSPLGHWESVVAVNATQVVLSGVDDALYLWDAVYGTTKARLSNQHQGGIRALAVDPDGQQLIAGDYQGNLSLWDLKQEFPLAMLTVESEPSAIWSLDWSPDGSRVAIAGGVRDPESKTESSLLMIYDPARREIVQKFPGHDQRVNAVRFSHDGHALYSAAEDLRIWSLPSGELKDQQALSGEELFGLEESADGTLLAVGSNDGTIHFVPTAKSLAGTEPSNAR